MDEVLSKPEGLREKKRRETLQRIVEAGFDLFLARGYEATTLDEVAEAAGVSRRTLFHYLESKDDILLAQLDDFAQLLKASVLENSSAGAPFDVARAALMKASARFETSKLIATIRLLRENETLRARRYKRHLRYEQVLYEGLCELWPGKERRDGLQLVAMASVGAVRIAVDKWLLQDNKGPLAKYIQDAFKKLKAEI